jgi:hypothetical protein
MNLTNKANSVKSMIKEILIQKNSEEIWIPKKKNNLQEGELQTFLFKIKS